MIRDLRLFLGVMPDDFGNEVTERGAGIVGPACMEIRDNGLCVVHLLLAVQRGSVLHMVDGRRRVVATQRVQRELGLQDKRRERRFRPARKHGFNGVSSVVEVTRNKVGIYFVHGREMVTLHDLHDVRHVMPGILNIAGAHGGQRLPMMQDGLGIQGQDGGRRRCRPVFGGCVGIAAARVAPTGREGRRRQWRTASARPAIGVTRIAIWICGVAWNRPLC